MKTAKIEFEASELLALMWAVEAACEPNSGESWSERGPLEDAWAAHSRLQDAWKAIKQ